MVEINDDGRRFIESIECEIGIKLLWSLSKEIGGNVDNKSNRETIFAIINILERNRKKILKDSRRKLLKFKTKIIINESERDERKDEVEIKVNKLEDEFEDESNINIIKNINDTELLQRFKVKLSNRNDTGSWENPIPNINGRPYDFFERKIFDKYVDYWENSKLSVPFSNWGTLENVDHIYSIISFEQIDNNGKGCKSIQEAIYKIRKFEQDFQNIPKEIVIPLIENGIMINNKKRFSELKNARIRDLVENNKNDICDSNSYFKVPQGLFFKMVINEHNNKYKYLDKNKKIEKNFMLNKKTNLVSNELSLNENIVKQCDCDFYKVKQKFIEEYNLYNLTNKISNDILTNRDKIRDSNLRLWMGAYSLPRNDKRIGGGEDGWFVAENIQCMGVADGVGEWEDLSGTSARNFSNYLMKNSLKYMQENMSNKIEMPSLLAKNALKESLLNCERSGIHGASTALVLCFDHTTGTIGFANMGDSGALVLRRLQFDTGKMEIVRRVKEMQHDFNCPYQFANLPPEKEWPELLEKGYHNIVKLASLEKESKKNQVNNEQTQLFACDNPELSQLLDVQVKEGDLIILGTDGLFDNLFDFEITSISGLTYSPIESKLFYKNLEFTTTPMVIAKSIALSAYYKSLDPFTRTPFANQAKRFHSGNKNTLISNQTFSGGKEDDITVLVAWVVNKEDLDILTKNSPNICDISKKI